MALHSTAFCSLAHRRRAHVCCVAAFIGRFIAEQLCRSRCSSLHCAALPYPMRCTAALLLRCCCTAAALLLCCVVARCAVLLPAAMRCCLLRCCSCCTVSLLRSSVLHCLRRVSLRKNSALQRAARCVVCVRSRLRTLQLSLRCRRPPPA